ncbi:MAG: acyltransferase [Desulfobacteraceae bacterium]|jgi:1-acyl-sn-glycerol-3-phosphate acyltransferase|nr:MAG: acyltransferase [Desulfobacteraceae bacterium]
MLHFLPAIILGPLSSGLLVINTILWFFGFFLFGMLKYLIPLESFRNFFTRVLIALGTGWIDCNRFIIWLTQNMEVDVEGLEKLPGTKKWVLIFSNHRAWVDIFILQSLFNHRIPFLKFFLKEELRKVPLMGFAWWSLDFPFMKRYSREVLAKHPELKGKDLESVKEACQRFKITPVSVINFLEGTRFSKEKHQKTNSPYKNLLPPKAGGVAIVLSEMADYLEGIVDVTIVYEPERVTFWDLFSGRIRKVTVRIHFFPVPEEISAGDYAHDPAFRERFQLWLHGIWEKKDGLIDQLKSQ